jgi:hypothetical protein
MIRVNDAHHLQVGDRTWFGEYDTSGSANDEARAALSDRLGYQFDYQRRQFLVRFESGWSVSIIWGSMTYSDNHDHAFGYGPWPELIEEPETVEAAVLHKDREGVEGDVMGYMEADALNSLLDFVSTLATTDQVQFGVIEDEADPQASWVYDRGQ